MIRHVVLVKMKKNLPASTIDEILSELTALQGVIPGIIGFSGGKDQSPEGLQRGNTFGFAVDFVDSAARDAYLPHPAHQKVGGFIVANAEGGVDGVTVLDWKS